MLFDVREPLQTLTDVCEGCSLRFVDVEQRPSTSISLITDSVDLQSFILAIAKPDDIIHQTETSACEKFSLQFTDAQIQARAQQELGSLRGPQTSINMNKCHLTLVKVTLHESCTSVCPFSIFVREARESVQQVATRNAKQLHESLHVRVC